MFEGLPASPGRNPRPARVSALHQRVDDGRGRALEAYKGLV